MPVPRQVPFTETQPPVIDMPPLYVDVDVLVTERFVTVVVPKPTLPLNTALLIVVLFIVPPFIVGEFIVVFVN